MIKKFESQFNGTKEMSEKHFIDPEILSSFLKENIPNFSGQLEIQEFIGGHIVWRAKQCKSALHGYAG